MVTATKFNWANVIDREDEKVEFGACHENYPWRPHRNDNHKFSSLSNAFNSEKNSLIQLLQNPRGNQNARNYKARGKALFAAVWYQDTEWAILCDNRYATIIPSSEMKKLSLNKSNDPAVREKLRRLFEASNHDQWRTLDSDFYRNNIGANG